MPDPIYYQWQNPFLLKTIYPLRLAKLADFLFCFYEVETWEQYKDKKPADIPTDVQNYVAAQKQKVSDSFDTYDRLKAYFLNASVSSIYGPPLFPQTDPDVLTRITNLHKNFATYFPKYTNPVHIKYFISERARELEDQLKTIDAEVTRNRRLLNNPNATPANKTDAAQKIQRLTTLSSGMLKKELSLLYQMLAAYEQITKYRQAVDQRQVQQGKAHQDAYASLKAARAQMDTLQPQLDDLRAATERLVHPPSYPPLRDYFVQPDASSAYQDFPSPDPFILSRIQALHKDFSGYYPNFKTPAQETAFISTYAKNFEALRDQKKAELAEKQRAAGWLDSSTPGGAANDLAIQAYKQITLPMVLRELNKLYDLQFSHSLLGQPNPNNGAQITQNQAKVSALEGQLAALRKTEADTLAAISQLEQQMNLTLKDQVQAFIAPQFVSVKDIARWKTDAYKQELQDLINNDKGAVLLERVVQEFVTRPERYPLWLQYMVIHFSGMRYQSAHGSWADPKDLLGSLRRLDVQKEINPLKKDELDALCDQKYLCYTAARAGVQVLGDTSENGPDVPALALAQDPKWRQKVDDHLLALAPNSGYDRRGALLQTCIDEEDYQIEQYTDQQALDALEDLKTELPDWMWREIVRVTQLRLAEVTSDNWEQVSDEDMLDRYARDMGLYRDILNDWKRANLTAWRDEHARTDDLVVSRAVCNEVAEHIQHIRGNIPPGGLTAKPEWYLRLEKASRANPPEKRSIFVKPKAVTDFRSGASLFWLRWINKEPNQWQITRPLTMGSGEDLVIVGPNSDGANTIINTGDTYKRTVTQKLNGGDNTSTQWLRWMHEATIIKVTETADGPSVLTFETATPIDDQRQATIGVYKRYATDLYTKISPGVMNGAFVGYTIEGAIPYDHLHDMLDWNHILLRDAFTADQIQQYWQKVETPSQVSFAVPEWKEEAQVEVAPLLLPGRWIFASCYEPGEDGQSMAVYQPRVALRRGVRLVVNKTGQVEFNGQAYYPITRCDYEPRAQDLYLPRDEAIEAPEGSTLPVKVREDLELYRISGIDLQGRPTFEPAGAHLVAGARLRVSTVHHIGPDTPGGGLIVGQRRRQFYLISACPKVREVEGLFIRASQVKKIKEKEYALEYLKQSTR